MGGPCAVILGASGECHSEAGAEESRCFDLDNAAVTRSFVPQDDIGERHRPVPTTANPSNANPIRKKPWHPQLKPRPRRAAASSTDGPQEMAMLLAQRGANRDLRHDNIPVHRFRFLVGECLPGIETSEVGMQQIPSEFAQNVTDVHGEAGSDWLSRLDETIAECERRWSLSVRPPFVPLSYNYVAPAVRADGTEAVLKLGVPHHELMTEMEALRVYDGSGMVRLFEADFGLGTMLLERAWGKR